MARVSVNPSDPRGVAVIDVAFLTILSGARQLERAPSVRHLYPARGGGLGAAIRRQKAAEERAEEIATGRYFGYW